MMRPPSSSQRRAGQRGFAYVAAIVLLIVMAAMATAMVRLSTTQNAMSVQDLRGIHASQAARAGVEWGLYQISSCTPDAPLEVTLTDFVKDTGFRVTVQCTAKTYQEGERPAGKSWEKTIYRIEAIACNSSAACPDDSIADRVDYVERKRVVTACRAGTEDCYAPD